MKSIGEVTKELQVTDHMLREWEKKDFLGDVQQVDGKRMYSEEQFKRISFIVQEVQKQRKEGIKRTEYSKIEAALFNKFGGEVIVREKEDGLSVLYDFMQQMQKRDQSIEDALENMKRMLLEIQSKPAQISGPNEEEYKNLVTNHQRLMEVHEKLVDRLEEIEKEKSELRKENKELKWQLQQEQESKKKKRWWSK